MRKKLPLTLALIGIVYVFMWPGVGFYIQKSVLPICLNDTFFEGHVSSNGPYVSSDTIKQLQRENHCPPIFIFIVLQLFFLPAMILTVIAAPICIAVDIESNLLAWSLAAAIMGLIGFIMGILIKRSKDSNKIENISQ